MTSSPNASVPSFTVPGLAQEDAAEVVRLLQDRLHALNDLALTLKHVHWNVVGPHFIAVHEMIDPQVDAVRAMVDATAERIATLGASPQRHPGRAGAARSWDDYSLGRASTQRAPRRARRRLPGRHRGPPGGDDGDGGARPGDARTCSSASCTELELFHWFVRAHLETSGGALSTAGEQARAAGRPGRRRGRVLPRLTDPGAGQPPPASSRARRGHRAHASAPGSA